MRIHKLHGICSCDFLSNLNFESTSEALKAFSITILEQNTYRYSICFVGDYQLEASRALRKLQKHQLALALYKTQTFDSSPTIWIIGLTLTFPKSLRTKRLTVANKRAICTRIRRENT